MRDSERKEVAQELAEPEAELAPAPRPDLNEVFDEVSKILTTRRWEVREEPFRGFDSPPGKF
ncbi:MAG: hypothetical protein HYY03_05490 [Chloroflexi bacterium]|nr:hypothetical protein [Chloroflexota bacterium]